MPLSPTEAASWDAVETAAKIRGREVSATEVLEAALARMEDAAPLGAVVTATPERARSRQAAEGAFAGVPTFIKDLAQLEGVETTWGSRGAGRYVSRKSEPIVRRFEQTGVAVLGKSATPELGLTATTEPLGRPPCRNPWNPARSSGGSSGGSAALVAAGVVPFAHGSDGGGSIRIPAACCGLVGLKPTRHRLDMEGSWLLPVNVATDGVLTRTVRDTVAFYEALEAQQRGRLPPIGPVAAQPARALKIGVYVGAPVDVPVHPDHQEAARAAGRLCASLGHAVEELRCPFEAQVIDDFLAYWGFVAWAQKASARALLHRGFDTSQLEPWSLAIARTFTAKPGAAFAATRRLRAFGRRYAAVMQAWDVLVCPTVAHPPPPLGWLGAELPFPTVFARLRGFACFTPLHNAAGAPALSLPWGLGAEDDLPVGVQLAAAAGGERLLLELALALEAARPWERLAPRRRWAPSAP